MDSKIKPVAEVVCARLRWHPEDGAYRTPDKFLNRETHYLYDQAALDAAVAEERERCAKLCEQSDEDGEGPDSWGWHAKDYAKAIRAPQQ